MPPGVARPYIPFMADAPATVRFYDWPWSPFCIKVRAILDYKGIAYERINPLAGGARASIRRRGRIGKVPALEMDGALHVDSTDIAYALERRFPAPAILPADAGERALCHVLEDWADESLYFLGLYYRWYEAEGRRAVPAAFGRSPTGRLAYAIYLRRILGQLRGQGTLRKPPDHVRSDLDRHVDAIDGLLGDGPFLLGTDPWLCDFALLGQLLYLGRTPVGGIALAERPRVATWLAAMKARTGRFDPATG